MATSRSVTETPSSPTARRHFRVGSAILVGPCRLERTTASQWRGCAGKDTPIGLLSLLPRRQGRDEEERTGTKSVPAARPRHAASRIFPVNWAQASKGKVPCGVRPLAPEAVCARFWPPLSGGPPLRQTSNRSGFLMRRHRERNGHARVPRRESQQCSSRRTALKREVYESGDGPSDVRREALHVSALFLRERVPRHPRPCSPRLAAGSTSSTATARAHDLDCASRECREARRVRRTEAMSARGGIRTRMPLRTMHFECIASARLRHPGRPPFWHR